MVLLKESRGGERNKLSGWRRPIDLNLKAMNIFSLFHKLFLIATIVFYILLGTILAKPN